MVEEGEYLLSHVGFSPDGVGRIILQNSGEFTNLQPIGHTVTLTFDTRQRYCRGWHDLATGLDTPCPDSQLVDNKYDQCAACQKRTGFNPAFYHAKSVSPQQEARNQQPHFLYLAYFADNLIKVGISHAQRGKARLLEQGARSALILETFPTAHIARHYEERIAALPGICEMVQLPKKIDALTAPHNQSAARQRLLMTCQTIEEALGVSFGGNQPEHLDPLYFPDTQPQFTDAYNCTPDHIISGTVTGMLGSLLFCAHQDTPVFLPLKKYVGYPLTLSHSETTLDLPARQISLF